MDGILKTISKFFKNNHSVLVFLVFYIVCRPIAFELHNSGQLPGIFLAAQIFKNEIYHVLPII